jgi:hypothetical protein
MINEAQSSHMLTKHSVTPMTSHCRIFLMIWGTEPRNNEVATMVKTSDQCKKEPITVDAAAVRPLPPLQRSFTTHGRACAL